MVRAPSPADDPPDPAAAVRLADELLDRLIRRLSTGRKALFLLGNATPGLLPRLVRCLDAFEGVHWCVSATGLLTVPVDAIVVLNVVGDELTWLNENRPLVSQRRLRVVLVAFEGMLERMRTEAVDFVDWVSHLMLFPPLPSPHVVAALREAAEHPMPIIWPGGDLDAAMALALPGARLHRVASEEPYDVLCDAMRSDEWVVVTGVEREKGLDRIRWAMAETGRADRCIAEASWRSPFEPRRVGWSPAIDYAAPPPEVGWASTWRSKAEFFATSRPARFTSSEAARIAALIGIESVTHIWVEVALDRDVDLSLLDATPIEGLPMAFTGLSLDDFATVQALAVGAATSLLWRLWSQHPRVMAWIEGVKASLPRPASHRIDEEMRSDALMATCIAMTRPAEPLPWPLATSSSDVVCVALDVECALHAAAASGDPRRLARAIEPAITLGEFALALRWARISGAEAPSLPWYTIVEAHDIEEQLVAVEALGDVEPAAPVDGWRVLAERFADEGRYDEARRAIKRAEARAVGLAAEDPRRVRLSRLAEQIERGGDRILSLDEV